MSDKISIRISYMIPEDVSPEEGAFPPVSEALASYLRTNTSKLEHPVVGLGGVKREGTVPGDGVNETVPFSFAFSEFKSITRARLTLDMEPRDTDITTDGLQFTNHTAPDELYGNDILRILPVGVRSAVNFDLTNVKLKDGSKDDLSELLSHGKLDVIYRDDALIYSIMLEIEGVAESLI